MTTMLVHWFSPPSLASSENTRKAHSLWVVSWPFFVVVALVLGIAVAVEPATLTRRAVTIGAVGLLVAILHEVSRRGRPVLASWLLVIGLTLVVTQRAWNTGGIHAPVAVFYTIFVIMAGALIGARAGFAVALVSLGGAVFLTIAEQLGWLVPRPGAGPALAALVFVVLTIGLTLVVQNLLMTRPPRGQRLSDDLVQMFVHDMKSPITVLQAQLNLLRQDVKGEMATNVDEALGGAKTLNRMANNLLDVSRLEAGRLPVTAEPTDIVGIAREVVSSMMVLEPQRDMSVTTRQPVVCRGDEQLLRRVLENLVSNAMKHTPPAGKIRVNVASASGGVRIEVQDEGSGIPPEARPRVFDKFSSAKLKTGTGYSSTGLGLAFCKLAVEAHGGSIRVEDARPLGSVFIVELPS
jgi:signal transduction histidine kinase